ADPPTFPVPGVFREAVTEFEVDARAVAKAGGPLLKALVSNPSGNVTETFVEDRGDGTYHVEYTPYEEGLHTVDVTYGGSPVPLSPFRVPVTEGCDPARVRVHGPGIQSGTTNVPNKFTVETRGAGTGGLGLAVEGPSEAKMSCTDNKDGSCSVEYIPYEPGTYSLNVTYGGHQVPGEPRAELSVSEVTAQVTGPSGQPVASQVLPGAGGSVGVRFVPQETGAHRVSVKERGQHVPGSPFQFTVGPLGEGGAHKVRAGGPGLERAEAGTPVSPQESGLKVHQPASFAVSLNGARGALDAKVHSPSGALEECHISEVTPDKYAVRFIPRENGVYSIDVKFEGSHIPGSPFKVRVGEPGQAGDPGLVSAYGPGLEGGTTGSAAEFVVNTSKAGPGALAVTIEGPSKVTMECQECPEGFRVSYTPMAPGSYLIHIKFGGPHHIVGSPFKAKVTGERRGWRERDLGGFKG
ncbi:filamin-A-like, partial [Cyanistes caeruleus]|uniref:filamin-A-like n=1 Tax=Cyanistes caeruleus TaxID=156563 RepID=UPI000CDA2126